MDFDTCRADHIRHRGFRDIGYHFYITRAHTRTMPQRGALRALLSELKRSFPHALVVGHHDLDRRRLALASTRRGSTQGFKDL